MGFAFVGLLWVVDFGFLVWIVCLRLTDSLGFSDCVILFRFLFVLCMLLSHCGVGLVCALANFYFVVFVAGVWWSCLLLVLLIQQWCQVFVLFCRVGADFFYLCLLVGLLVGYIGWLSCVTCWFICLGFWRELFVFVISGICSVGRFAGWLLFGFCCF